MNNKYIANALTNLIPINNDIVIIKSFKGSTRIKGAGMFNIVQDMISHFNEPTLLDDVVSKLSKKYSEHSLRRLFAMLVDKDVLIREQDYEILNRHEPAYLDKFLLYKPEEMDEIINELKSKRIGIVGMSQLTSQLLVEFAKSNLLFNFDIPTANENFSQSIIENSDFIIASGDFYDHIFFNEINKLCIKMNKSWLRIAVDGSFAEIGPLFIPKETCCYACLQTRGHQNMSNEELAIDSFYSSQAYRDNKINSITTNSLASIIACAETVKFLSKRVCNIKEHIIMIDSNDFQTQTHYIYKDYQCPVCVKEVF